MKNKKIIFIVTGVIILAGAFYGGMVYGKNKVPTRGQGQGTQFSSQNSAGNTGGIKGIRNAGGLGGLTAGEIISKDAKSITVKLADGGSKIIFLADKTSVTKMVSGNIADLSTGAQVSVTGTANADGSITAQSVQIRPNITSSVVK